MKFIMKAFDRWQPPGGIPEFMVRNVTQMEVLQMIKKFKKNSHVYGRDKIDAATVKMAAQFLVAPITHVINLSLTEKVFLQK